MTLAVANPDLEVRSGRMVHNAAFTITICHWTLVQILNQTDHPELVFYGFLALLQSCRDSALTYAMTAASHRLLSTSLCTNHLVM